VGGQVRTGTQNQSATHKKFREAIKSVKTNTSLLLDIVRGVQCESENQVEVDAPIKKEKTKHGNCNGTKNEGSAIRRV
jgi:hypothetical protein